MAWFVKDLQQQIGKWADEAIGKDRCPRATFDKLTYEEVPELFRNPKDPGEYADVAILLIDYAYLNGVDMEKAITDKLAILKRDGMYIDENGIAKRNKPKPEPKQTVEVKVIGSTAKVVKMLRRVRKLLMKV